MASLSFYLNNKLVISDTKYTILQASSSVGVEIPRFCYHPNLSVAANCRMCLVEVQGSNKPVASCAMQVTPESRVTTLSFFVKKTREAVLEFLLINHPLDCPICDQGGECDLQDQTLIFGSDRGRFYEKKRAVKNFFAGWLVKTFMTRCIHCTRCVRFNSEIEGESKIGILGRGGSMKISNFVNNKLNSGFSGNLVDLCPVGALVSKPYSFTARPWELRTPLSLDLSDSLLGKVRLDIKGDEIKRVLPSTSGSSESFFISDKGRFFLDGLFYQRLSRPDSKKLFVRKNWSNSLNISTTSFLSNLKKKTKLFLIKNFFCEMEFYHLIKSNHPFLEEHLTKKYQTGNWPLQIFSKFRKTKESFVFKEKANCSSEIRDFFFNVADYQSDNAGISSSKKFLLSKGTFLGFKKKTIKFEITFFLQENSLVYG